MLIKHFIPHSGHLQIGWQYFGGVPSITLLEAVTWWFNYFQCGSLIVTVVLIPNRSVKLT